MRKKRKHALVLSRISGLNPPLISLWQLNFQECNDTNSVILNIVLMFAAA